MAYTHYVEDMPVVMYDYDNDIELFKNNFREILNDNEVTSILEIRYRHPERIYFSPKGTNRYAWAENLPVFRNHYEEGDRFVFEILKCESAVYQKTHEYEFKFGFYPTGVKRIIEVACTRLFNNPSVGDAAVFVVFGATCGKFFTCGTTAMLDCEQHKKDLVRDCQFAKRIFDQLKHLHGKVRVPEMKNDMRMFVRWIEA